VIFPTHIGDLFQFVLTPGKNITRFVGLAALVLLEEQGMRWEGGACGGWRLLSQRKTAPMLLQQHCSSAAAAIGKSFFILSTRAVP